MTVGRATEYQISILDREGNLLGGKTNEVKIRVIQNNQEIPFTVAETSNGILSLSVTPTSTSTVAISAQVNRGHVTGSPFHSQVIAEPPLLPLEDHTSEVAVEDAVADPIALEGI